MDRSIFARKRVHDSLRRMMMHAHERHARHMRLLTFHLSVCACLCAGVGGCVWRGPDERSGSRRAGLLFAFTGL